MENKGSLLKVERRVHVIKDGIRDELKDGNITKCVSDAKKNTDSSVPFLLRVSSEVNAAKKVSSKKKQSRKKLGLVNVIHEPFDCVISSQELCSHLRKTSSNPVDYVDLSRVSLDKNCLARSGIRKICRKSENKNIFADLLKNIFFVLGVLSYLIGWASDLIGAELNLSPKFIWSFSGICALLYILLEIVSRETLKKRFKNFVEQTNKMESAEQIEKLSEVYGSLSVRDFHNSLPLKNDNTVILINYNACSRNVALLVDRYLELISETKFGKTIIVFSEYIPSTDKLFPTISKADSRIFYLNDISVEEKKKIAEVFNPGLLTNHRFFLFGMDFICGINAARDNRLKEEADKKAEDLRKSINNFAVSAHEKFNVSALIAFAAHLNVNFGLSESEVKKVAKLGEYNISASGRQKYIYDEESSLAQLIFNAIMPRRSEDIRPRKSAVKTKVKTQSINVCVGKIFNAFEKDFALIDYLVRYDSSFSDLISAELLDSIVLVKMIIHRDVFVSRYVTDLAYRQYTMLSFTGNRFDDENYGAQDQKLNYTLALLDMFNGTHQFAYHHSLISAALDVMEANPGLAAEHANSDLLRSAVDNSIIFALDTDSSASEDGTVEADAFAGVDKNQSEQDFVTVKPIGESLYIRYADLVHVYYQQNGGLPFDGELSPIIPNVVNLEPQARNKYLNYLVMLNDRTLINYLSLLADMLVSTTELMSKGYSEGYSEGFYVYKTLLPEDHFSAENKNINENLGRMIAFLKSLLEGNTETAIYDSLVQISGILDFIAARDKVAEEDRQKLINSVNSSDDHKEKLRIITDGLMESMKNRIDLEQKSADIVTAMQLLCSEYSFIRCKVIGLLYYLVNNRIALINSSAKESKYGYDAGQQKMFYTNPEFYNICTPLSFMANGALSEDIIAGVKTLFDSYIQMDYVVPLFTELLTQKTTDITGETIRLYLTRHNGGEEISKKLAGYIRRNADSMTLEMISRFLYRWESIAQNLNVDKKLLVDAIDMSALSEDQKFIVNEYRELFVNNRNNIDISNIEALASRLNLYYPSYSGLILYKLVVEYNSVELLQNIDAFRIFGGTEVSSTSVRLVYEYLYRKYGSDSYAAVADKDVNHIDNLIERMQILDKYEITKVEKLLYKLSQYSSMRDHHERIQNGIFKVQMLIARFLELESFDFLYNMRSFERNGSFEMVRYLRACLPSSMTYSRDDNFTVPDDVISKFESIEPAKMSVQMNRYELMPSYSEMIDLLAKDESLRRELVTRYSQREINRKFVEDISILLECFIHDFVNPEAAEIVKKVADKLKAQYKGY